MLWEGWKEEMSSPASIHVGCQHFSSHNLIHYTIHTTPLNFDNLSVHKLCAPHLPKVGYLYLNFSLVSSMFDMLPSSSRLGSMTIRLVGSVHETVLG